MSASIDLGTGILTWYAHERHTDRYGYVWLMTDGSTSLSPTSAAVPFQNLDRCGGRGRLLAEVIASRQSTHIGDLFHGIFPRKTPEGTLVELGLGCFSKLVAEGSEPDSRGVQVGLKPLDGRHEQWLNVQALYDVHEHLVRLWFQPEEVALHE